MSRLIDADKLQKDLEKVKKESATLSDILHIIGFQIVVDAQPTAFDVDKVVSELERKRDYHYKQMEEVDFEKDIFGQHIFEEEHNRGIGLSEAIEIVRRCGTDE